MGNEYRIMPDGRRFEILDLAGERIGMYETKRKASQAINVCKANDILWDSARLLVRIAVNALMKMRGIDYRTAQYWIREAAD
jgi:hypothetical protein